MNLRKMLGFGVIFVVLLVSSVESAPNNSTSADKKTPTDAKPTTVVIGNSTKTGNKTTSEEDCEPEPEPESTSGSKNATGTDRKGKNLNLDKDKYTVAAEPEPVNETANKTQTRKSQSSPGSITGDAEKLQGSNTTTTAPAPAKGGSAPSSSPLWANVIIATLLTSFTYSAL